MLFVVIGKMGLVTRKNFLYSGNQGQLNVQVNLATDGLIVLNIISNRVYNRLVMCKYFIDQKQ